MFQERWNNGGSYQRERDRDMEGEVGAVVTGGSGARPGQGASEEHILRILSLSSNNEGS